MVTPRALTYEWRGVDEGWAVVFNETFTGNRTRGDFLREIEAWVSQNNTGACRVYWSGEVAFSHEDDAMLCLLTFA